MTRTTLTLFFIGAMVIVANAQPGYGWSGWHGALPGDTVVLNVSGHNGTIQWQESTDSITWTNISGATTTPYLLINSTSPTNKRYFRAEITNVAICENSPWYSSIICFKTSITLISVGDWFHGGIIFYTDGSGHFLIAPQQDQGVRPFADIETFVPGATSLTDGNSNTTVLYNSYGQYYAAGLCYLLVLNGYSDWFLPAKDQLNYLYLQRAIVGGFFNHIDYWSSSDINQYRAWCHDFNSGNQGDYYRDYYSYIRCVRSFSLTDNITLTNSYATASGQPVTATITTQPQPITQNMCLGDSLTFSVAATGTSPVYYQWKRDGVDISGATNATFTKSSITLADEGIYTCEVTNLCRSVVSDNAELKVIELTANAGTNVRICRGQNTQLMANAATNHIVESGTLTCQWSPSTALTATNIINPTANPLTTTTYTITVTDQLSCSITDQIQVIVGVPYENEQVCLVTVDTSTWKNKVMWEKTDNVGTEYYLVYKETGTNSYSQIGNVEATQPGEYVDLFSQPEIHGDKYKITVLDTCENESDLNNCYYHKTVNLTIAAFGSTMGLNWDDYVDESGNYLPFRYYIYRGTSPTNMALYDSVSGSFNSYNDNNVFAVYYYMIGVKKSPPCNVNGSEMSFSNKKDNSTLVNINSIDLLPGTILISPNPMTNTATLTIPNFSSKTTEPLQIIDITGKVVKIISTSNVNLDNNKAKIVIEKGDLKPGVYFVELKADRTYRGKLIIE